MTKSAEEVREIVLRALAEVVPELAPDELRALDPETDLREELDIDSMDLLRFMVGLHVQTGVEIPEADASKLVTISGAVGYITSALR